MTKQQAWITVGGVMGGVLLTIATPELTRETKIILWLAFAAYWICFLIGTARQNRGKKMTFPVVLGVGALLGAVAGLLAWFVFPPKGDETPVAAAPKDVKSDKTGEQQTSEDLEFYFHSFLMGGGRGNPDGPANIQFSGATMTNRSSRKMHLALWAHAYYWKDNGEPTAIIFQPKWNPRGLEENTGETTVDLDAFETKEGSLILFFDKPKQDNVKQWNINVFKNVYIHAFDSVTGKHIAFRASPGYPDAKRPWPLPSPAKLLALDFPQADATALRNLPAMESLDLVARTQLSGYRNNNRLSISAVISNRSNNRMKLQINLLTRNSVNDKEWRTVRGVIEPVQKKDRGQLDFYALDFGPGNVAQCSLVFANTGFTNREGKELKESPSLSLLEIFDEVSGKKVWCAIEPGYPPGTDMRLAAIQPPPPIPKSNSDNPTKDETKDTK